MGNLVGRAFPKRDYSGATVKSYYDEAKQLIRTDDSSKGALDVLINELREILTKVEDSEKQFYAKLGVQDLTWLNIKLHNLEENYSPLLARGKIYWEVLKKYEFNSLENAKTPEEMAEALQETLLDFLSSNSKVDGQTFYDLLLSESNELINPDDVKTFLQKYFKGEVTGKNFGRFVLQRIKNGIKIDVGLGKLIKGYDKNTGKFIIDVGQMNVSSGFKQKLSNLLDMIWQAQNNGKQKKNKVPVSSVTQQGFRDDVNTIILANITNPTTKMYVSRILKGPADQFDLMRNVASVAGYLGEIRAVAMLQELTGGDARGTGALKTATTGEEIPIDVVCEGFGFQIKNYTMLKGQTSVSFSRSLQISDMLSGRMQLNGTIYDILMNLFGTYQYNQPFKGNTYSDGQGNNIPVNHSTVKQYSYLYNAIPSLFYSLKPLFDSRVPQMLKISEIFSVLNDMDFLQEKLYFNTFYWINKHLVPSSYILKNIIQQLTNNTEAAITTSYQLSKPTSDMTFQQNPNLVGQSVKDAANKLSMRYNIIIDLSKLNII